MIDNIITPHFKNQEFYLGILAGLSALVQQTGYEFDSAVLPQELEQGLEAAPPDIPFGLMRPPRFMIFIWLYPLIVLELLFGFLLGSGKAYKAFFKNNFAAYDQAKKKIPDLRWDLFNLWVKKTGPTLNSFTGIGYVLGAFPIIPALMIVRLAPVALAIPLIYLFSIFLLPRIFRVRKLPYFLSYGKIENNFQKFKTFLETVPSEEERNQMGKLYLSGYTNIAMMKLVIKSKGHWDEEYFHRVRYSAGSSSGSSSSGSSFSGGGGSFGGGGASGGW